MKTTSRISGLPGSSQKRRTHRNGRGSALLDSPGRRLGEWRNLARHGFSEVGRFTREYPFLGLAGGFLAGALFTSLFRRRS